MSPDASVPLDFEAIEAAVRRQALQLAADAVARRLNRDRSDYSGPHRSCPCGREARYAGRLPKTFQSVVGPLTLERAYYYCDACGQGQFPRDRALGLEQGSLSPGVLRMAGAAAALVSFAEASTLLDELAGVAVSAKHVERATEALGDAISAAERGREAFAQEPPAAPTMYLGMDGTAVPVRKEAVAGRAGKQPDGSARTREVKLVTVWTAESTHPKTGHPQRDEGSVSYTAAIESAASRDTDPQPSAFAQRVWREAVRRGFPRARRRVVLGDGAAWIWNICQEHFPGAIQIVDLYHSKEHLWAVARQLHPGDQTRREAWAEAQCAALEDGRLDEVLTTLRSATGCEEALKCAAYIQGNRQRMRYDAFRAAGLCVGSGVLEAGCKSTVCTRLKRPGMHWTVAGANAIISLRCCVLSGRYEDYWAYRSAPTEPAVSNVSEN